VEVITLAEVVQAAQKAFPDLAGNDKIFLLKLVGGAQTGKKVEKHEDLI